jgi:DNA-directed RNA polymerase subunit RPC12/RpoP
MQVNGKIRVEEGKDGKTRLVGTLTVTGEPEDDQALGLLAQGQKVEHTCSTCGYTVRLCAHYTGQANCPICGHRLLVSDGSSYEPSVTSFPYPPIWLPHRESVTSQYPPNCTCWHRHNTIRQHHTTTWPDYGTAAAEGQ